MASSSVLSGKVAEVTRDLPQTPNLDQQVFLEGRHQFMKAKPNALGTVQIMIGVLTLLFGITDALGDLPVSVLSGVFGWGALVYIASGSVTVAAEKSLSRCLINTSLALNITAAVTAVSAVTIYIVDAVLQGSEGDRNPSYMIVLAVFQSLELVVSLIVTGYGCKVTCCWEQPLVIVQTIDSGTTIDIEAPPQYQTVSADSVQPRPQVEIIKNPEDLASAVPPPYEDS